MKNVREAALDSLLRCTNDGAYSNLEVGKGLSDVPEKDRALYTALVYGVLERGITLDYIISCLTEREPDKRTKTILKLGIYQLAFTDKIPEHAAVNECVNLASSKTKGFVNAVLRSYIRKKDGITYPDNAVKYSIPRWLYDLWVSDYGKETADSVCETLVGAQPLSVRVNTLKTDVSGAEEKLRARNIASVKSSLANGFLRLDCAVSEISDMIENGEIFVQGETSGLCVETLDVRAGMSVLDACAAPGGKSFSAALNMENDGCIISCDIHKNKLPLIENGAKRLGIGIIKAELQNGRERRADFVGAFERVLCDVPCSGLGVISKKPDIALKDPKTLVPLPGIQYAILENCAEYVAKGGILVYSTCTLRRAENEENVTRFLSRHPEFEDCGMRTVFPFEGGCDGFFIAKMKRI